MAFSAPLTIRALDAPFAVTVEVLQPPSGLRLSHCWQRQIFVMTEGILTLWPNTYNNRSYLTRQKMFLVADEGNADDEYSNPLDPRVVALSCDDLILPSKLSIDPRRSSEEVMFNADGKDSSLPSMASPFDELDSSLTLELTTMRALIKSREPLLRILPQHLRDIRSNDADLKYHRYAKVKGSGRCFEIVYQQECFEQLSAISALPHPTSVKASDVGLFFPEQLATIGSELVICICPSFQFDDSSIFSDQKEIYISLQQRESVLSSKAVLFTDGILQRCRRQLKYCRGMETVGADELPVRSHLSFRCTSVVAAYEKVEKLKSISLLFSCVWYIVFITLFIAFVLYMSASSSYAVASGLHKNLGMASIAPTATTFEVLLPNIATLSQLYEFLSVSLPQVLYPENPKLTDVKPLPTKILLNYLLQYNFVVGGISVRQVRSSSKNCPEISPLYGPRHSGLGNVPCYSSWEYNTNVASPLQNKSVGGVYGATPPLLLGDLYTVVDLLGNYYYLGGIGYEVILPGTNKTVASALLNSLKAEQWIDSQTRFVLVEFSTRNPVDSAIAVIYVLFCLPISGALQVTFSIDTVTSFNPSYFGVTISIFTIPLCIIVVLIIFAVRPSVIWRRYGRSTIISNCINTVAVHIAYEESILNLAAAIRRLKLISTDSTVKESYKTLTSMSLRKLKARGMELQEFLTYGRQIIAFETDLQMVPNSEASDNFINNFVRNVKFVKELFRNRYAPNVEALPSSISYVPKSNNLSTSTSMSSFSDENHSYSTTFQTASVVGCRKLNSYVKIELLEYNLSTLVQQEFDCVHAMMEGKSLFSRTSSTSVTSSTSDPVATADKLKPILHSNENLYNLMKLKEQKLVFWEWLRVIRLFNFKVFCTKYNSFLRMTVMMDAMPTIQKKKSLPSLYDDMHSAKIVFSKEAILDFIRTVVPEFIRLAPLSVRSQLYDDLSTSVIFTNPVALSVVNEDRVWSFVNHMILKCFNIIKMERRTRERALWSDWDVASGSHATVWDRVTLRAGLRALSSDVSSDIIDQLYNPTPAVPSTNDMGTGASAIDPEIENDAAVSEIKRHELQQRIESLTDEASILADRIDAMRLHSLLRLGHLHRENIDLNAETYWGPWIYFRRFDFKFPSSLLLWNYFDLMAVILYLLVALMTISLDPFLGVDFTYFPADTVYYSMRGYAHYFVIRNSIAAILIFIVFLRFYKVCSMSGLFSTVPTDALSNGYSEILSAMLLFLFLLYGFSLTGTLLIFDPGCGLDTITQSFMTLLFRFILRVDTIYCSHSNVYVSGFFQLLQVVCPMMCMSILISVIVYRMKRNRIGTIDDNTYQDSILFKIKYYLFNDTDGTRDSVADSDMIDESDFDVDSNELIERTPILSKELCVRSSNTYEISESWKALQYAASIGLLSIAGVRHLEKTTTKRKLLAPQHSFRRSDTLLMPLVDDIDDGDSGSYDIKALSAQLGSLKNDYFNLIGRSCQSSSDTLKNAQRHSFIMKRKARKNATEFLRSAGLFDRAMDDDVDDDCDDGDGDDGDLKDGVNSEKVVTSNSTVHDEVSQLQQVPLSLGFAFAKLGNKFKYVSSSDDSTLISLQNECYDYVRAISLLHFNDPKAQQLLNTIP